MSRRPLLIITIVVMMLLGTATAEDNPAVDQDFSILRNTTISCSTAFPSAKVGCFWEKPIWVIDNLEIALGIDARAAFNPVTEPTIAPYAIVAWYEPTWSAWAEFQLPDMGITVLGSPDWFSAGFTYRFP